MPERNYIEEALGDLRSRLPGYELYWNYWYGRHRLAFATRKFRSVFANTLRAFADNLCPAVLDALADRLEVLEFSVEQERFTAAGVYQEESDTVETDSKVLSRLANELWEFNRLPRHAGEVHLEALRCGDAYVCVWPDPVSGLPVFYPHRAHQVTVRYDPEDPRKLAWGAKVWRDSERHCRLNLYFPDRIQKYRTLQPIDRGQLPKDSKGFAPWSDEGEEFPLPNPYGQVPIFHFANNTALGYFGVSELQPVIPIQDALNKAHADLLVASEFAALPQRWVVGMDPGQGPDGKPQLPAQFTAGADRIFFSSSEGTKFGQFDQADLGPLIAAIESYRLEIARVTGTPIHYLVLQGAIPPSGAALRILEARLIRRARDRQLGFGQTWEEAMAFALRILGHQGRPVAKWVDPAPRSEMEHAQVLQIKQGLGVPKARLLQELGYTDEEVQEMLAAQEESQQQGMLQQGEGEGEDDAGEGLQY